MLYKIGDMAKLLGLSQEALRKFERRGLITPVKDEENGYRYYGTLDITSLIRCRSYHRYGFSMNEIAGLMNTRDLDFIIDKYKEREDSLRERIRMDSLMLRYLEDIRRTTESIQNNYQKCSQTVCPPCYSLEYMQNDVLTLSGKVWDYFSNWMERVPFSALSIRWNKDLILQGQTDFIASLCVPEEYAHELAYYLGPPVVYFPARPCVYTLSSEDQNRFDAPQSFEFILDYCRERGLTPADDPYCRTFLSYDKGGNYTRFRQIWLPVTS